MFGAAVSKETARVVGGWADGLVTLSQPLETLRRVVDAFREGGGEDKPVSVQVHLSWAEDEETALAIAHDQWRTQRVRLGAGMWNLELPAQFDAAAQFVRPEDVCRSVLVSSDLGRHVAWLHELFDARRRRRLPAPRRS